MKKIYLLFLVLLLIKPALPQKAFLINFGVNYPVNYSGSNLSRSLGGEFGIRYNKLFKPNIGYEFGFKAGLYGRSNLVIETNNVNYNYTHSYARIDFYFPALLTYHINKFDIKTGVSLNIHPFCHLGKYLSYDPEVSRPNEYSDLNLSISISTGFNLVVTYKIGEKLNPYFEFNTIKVRYMDSKIKYGLITLGILYKISR